MDKRVLDQISLPYVSQAIKEKNFARDAASHIEMLVENNFISREKANEMYESALVI